LTVGFKKKIFVYPLVDYLFFAKKYDILLGTMKGFLLKVVAALLVPSPRLKHAGYLLVLLVFLGLIIGRPALAEENATAGALNWLLGLLAGVLTTVAQMAGQLVVVLIGLVTIPLMTYNEFSTSPIIGMGWSVVRDAVNMFFVIVLILIAFGTILGIERFKWRQQVPRLLIMAIMINFSRTLCGILIDFSQVIMLTFVNAVKDIAGGNFIQMFGIRSIFEANDSSSLFDGTNTAGVQGYDLFVAAAVAVIMMFIVLIAITFLTIILAYRIVVLWALVTVAPLAWFTKVLGGISPNGDKGYKQWWSKFSCALQIGPVLTFFLWLALAVAGSGEISTSSGFVGSNAPAGEGLDTGSLIKALGMNQMVSFIIGILLLFVGFDAANDACSGSDGVVSGLMGKAKGLSKTVAMAPVAATAWVGAKGVQGTRALGRGTYNQTVGRGVGALKGKAATWMEKKAGEKTTSTFMRNIYGKQAAKMKASRAAEAEATMKDRPMSDAELKASLEGGPSKFDVGGKKYAAMMKEAMSRDSFRTELGSEGMAKLLNRKVGNGTAKDLMDNTFSADPAHKKRMLELEKKAPSMFGDERIKEIEGDERIKELDKSEFANAKVRAQISGQKFKYEGKDGEWKEIDMVQAIEQGRLGQNVKRNWEKGSTVLAASKTPEKLMERKVGEIDVNDIEEQNLSPEVAAKIFTEGTAAQAVGLGKDGARQSRVKKDAEKILEEVKKQATSTGYMPDAGEFTQRNDRMVQTAKGNMFKAGANFDQAFEIDGQGGFSNTDAKADFASMAKGDGDITSAAIQHGGEAKDEALKAMTAKTAGDMVRKLKASKEGSGERAELQRQVNLINQALGEYLNGTPIDTSPDELRRVFDAMRVLDLETTEAAPTPAAPTAALPPLPVIKREDIEKLANEIWQGRTKIGKEGDSNSDWEAAKEAITKELAQKIYEARLATGRAGDATSDFQEAVDKLKRDAGI